MNAARDPSASTLPDRPVGIVRPEADAILYAFRALQRRKKGETPTDANNLARRLDALPESSLLERAWKQYLLGRFHLDGGTLREALPLLLEAAALALAEAALAGDGTGAAERKRLGALALHDLGTLHRRREQPADAFRNHEVARRIRDRVGSWEEVWESTLALGLDQAIAHRFAEAQSWYRQAVELAGKCTEDPLRKEAIVWEHAATAFERDGRYAEAVEAARAARDRHRRHDPGGVDAARADVRLGQALLQLAQHLMEAGDDRATQTLQEAQSILETGRQALAAFGQPWSEEADLAARQRDFAERLARS